jgi:hypothetical protein
MASDATTAALAASSPALDHADASALTIVCAWCGRIRRRTGWRRPASRASHVAPTAPVSHAMCPRCLRALSAGVGAAG